MKTVLEDKNTAIRQITIGYVTKNGRKREENSSNKSQSEVSQRYEDGAHRGPTEVQEATTQQPHVRWYHTQFGRTIHQREAQRGPAKVPQRITRFKKQPHSNRTSAGTTRSLGGRIHHRGAHRGPAEVPQRSAEVPQRSTMVNDGHTTRPRCATRSLGGRYINGKPEEVPPDTRRSRGSRSNRHAPQWSTTATAKVPLSKSLPSSGRIWTCGGVRNAELQESIAPNPNLNDFILEPRSGSQKSADGYRYHPERLHPGAKVWIAEVRRRVPLPRPRQGSAEAITVSGIIIVEEDDQSTNQYASIEDHTSIEES